VGIKGRGEEGKRIGEGKGPHPSYKNPGSSTDRE